MENEQTILLVGGPDSGKTNYLGRLWLSIRNNSGPLKVDGIPDDLEYLNQLADFYYRGHFAPHTPKDNRMKVIIPIMAQNEENILSINLTVPDVSGEEWLSIYQKRSWSIDWEQTFSNVNGCLLFVRVDSSQNVPAIDWVSCYKLFQKVPENHSEVPTQIILVDWLQCLISAFGEKKLKRKPRIGIIVSAFDLIPNEQKMLGPDMYLKSNFPLFWQFIYTIENWLDIRVFGTSIAGGDFDADQDFRKKFLHESPEDAGCVFYHSNSKVLESKDIALPVIWVMGL